MSTSNPHSEYIEKRIATWQRRIGHKLRFKITAYCCENSSAMLSTYLFANLVKQFFTRQYVARQICPDCGVKATQRCHGKGEERGVLLERALSKIMQNTEEGGGFMFDDLVYAFFREHKNTTFTFKCAACHVKDTYVPSGRSE